MQLLGAFVWRNHGMLPTLTTLSLQICFCLPARPETHELGFTYVQGMNVLATPLLYTMPSELKESRPLYVQPTLEGARRGLKLPLLCDRSSRLSIMSSWKKFVSFSVRSLFSSVEAHICPSFCLHCSMNPKLRATARRGESEGC